MLKRLLKIRRAVRTCFRSFRAAMHGPERGKEKVRRVLTSLRAQERKKFPDDHENFAKVYFKKRAYRRLKQLIFLAQRSIDIQMFIWLADTTGRDIAKLLTDAANRGVIVTVRKEIIGDIFEFGDDFVTTKNDNDAVWQAFWHHPNISVLHENKHDHSKTFVIDDELLLVSSMNIGDAYCNNWHECLVELRGERFVKEYRQGNTELPQRTKQGCVTVLRSDPDHPMLPAVLGLLKSAKKSIRIEMAYFSDPQIIDLLAKKTYEGVYVFLVMPRSQDVHHHANLEAAAKMLKLSHKNRTFVFRYPRGQLHTKMIIIDRKTLFIGSTNFITSSLMKMGETNVLIHRRPKSCLRIARRRFAKDVLQSAQMEAKELTRSLREKFLSWLNL